VNLVLAGDCGVDRYVGLGLDRPGGITLNVAAHARRLFAPSARITVVTAVGTDRESGMVRDALQSVGVESFVRELSGSTSLQLIDLEPSGEKIFLSYHQGVLEGFRVEAEERALIADSDLLVAPHYRQIDGFFSSVMASPSRGLRAVDFADIAEDPGTRNVERFVDRLDIAFFGLLPPGREPGRGPEDASGAKSADASHSRLIDDLEAIARRRGKLFIVTLGPGGSLALGGKDRIHCRAEPVEKVVDTTGAGDTFAAAFLAEYVRSEDVAVSLARGAEEAARTIQRVGAF
jgi:fructoselysine 6-kinase